MQVSKLAYPKTPLVAFLLFTVLLFVVFRLKVEVSVGIAGLVLIYAGGIGRSLLVKLNLGGSTLLNIAVGIGVLSVGLNFLSLTPVFSRQVFWSVNVCFAVIILPSIFSFLKNCGKHTKETFEKEPSLLIFYFLFFITYLLKAADPIKEHDAIAKHANIPFRIFSENGLRFPILEFVGYGDYALGNHMLFLFGAGLNNPKMMPITNVFFAFLAAILLYKIASWLNPEKIFRLFVVLIALSTPVFFSLGTVCYVDTAYVFLCLAGLHATLQEDLIPNIKARLIITSLLFGFSFFFKQHAIYLALPCLGWIILSFLRRERPISVKSAVTAFCLPFILLILPSLTNLTVVFIKTGNPLFPFMNGFFKSPFFSKGNFVDPFSKHPWTMNILNQFVFETEKHTEYMNGGFGVFLLLLYCFIPSLIVYKSRRGGKLLLGGLLVAGTILASFFTFNARYYLSLIMAALPLALCSGLDCLELLKKKEVIFKPLAFVLLASVLVFNLMTVFSKSNFWGFRTGHLELRQKKDFSFPIYSLLEPINTKGIRVLSADLSGRADFIGELYNLNWYNTFILEKINETKVDVVSFLDSFDYVILSPQNSRLWDLFDKTEGIKQLTLVEKVDGFELYRSKRVNNNFLDKLYYDFERFHALRASKQ